MCCKGFLIVLFGVNYFAFGQTNNNGPNCPDLNQDFNMILPTRWTGYFYQDNVVFQCAEGYYLSSAGNLICQSSSLQNIGQWSGTQPTCLRKRCPDLHRASTMILPTKWTGYVYQDQVVFQCAEGYTLSSVQNLVCLASRHQNMGRWSRSQPSCQRKKCPDLHIASNMISPTKFTGYVYHDQVVFKCAEGYSLSSAENLICQASSQENIGHWSRKQPTCQRKGCPDFRQDSNMILPTKLTGYVYQDQVAFQCDEGYSLSSAGNLICLASSQQTIVLWSSPQPSCLPKQCDRLNVDERVLVSENSCKYKDNVTLSCKEGYNGASLILNCYTNGSWPTQRPNCTAVPCPALNNTIHMDKPIDMSGYHYGANITFQCVNGYILSEPPFITCLSSRNNRIGHWSKQQPICSVEKGQPNKDSGKRNGVYMSYGLFGGILAAIVIISTAVHIGTCYYYRNRLRKHVTVYEDIKFNTVERQNYSNVETYAELT